MPTVKAPIDPEKFVWVRSIFGKGPDASKRYHYIPDGGMNGVIKSWQDKQPERELGTATPSSVMTCPRSLWLQMKGVEPTTEKTWALKQRMLLGRLFENQFADMLSDEGLLLKHWKDDPGVEPFKFRMGEDDDELVGTPDYVVRLTHEGKEIVAISDAKTSRSDSFGYVPIEDDEIWEDGGWYKNKIQLTAYYMLCHQNKEWFLANNIPLPTHCHLFSYALDDGVVRREVVWQPTQEDMQTVLDCTVRFNRALKSEIIPDCTCAESKGEFEVKFCRYGIVEQGKKVAESCCDESLINNIKE